MYSTCIFCHSSLGKNEAIEHFPVGRKLAFDGSKGRLWVVCGKCGRWNLTPLEERWEAIEDCEREYRATRLRTSTGEIGLGRVREGTDLVRIGAPLRPEFAAWRYGKHFRNRRTRVVASGVLGAGLLLTGAVTGIPMLTTLGFPLTTLFGALVFSAGNEVSQSRRFLMRQASLAAGRKVKHLNEVEVRIVPYDDDQGWALRFFGYDKPRDFTGREALNIAHKVMPALNVTGGSAKDVTNAVAQIEAAGAPDRYFKTVIDYARVNRMMYMPIGGFPSAIKLAVEMAAHEESERHAMAGELAQLETDWKEAEEIAAIADDMFLPRAVTEFIRLNRPNGPA